MRRLLVLFVVLTQLAKLGISQDENLALATGDRSDTDRYGMCQRLAQAAREHLRSGRITDAMKVLGDAADLDLPHEEASDNGLASAAASLHRQLAALDAEERFELLRDWSMPTETRRTVRVLTSITPIDAPPAVFARALGERQQRNAFAVPDVGDVRGIFSSAWELVTTANEAGMLRRLTADLSKLVEGDVPNADFALALAKVVGARRADKSLLAELREYATALQVQSSSSRFATLPFEQRVWHFGFGQFDADAERTKDFALFPAWNGHTWHGGPIHPDKVIGWTAVRATGGHPGAGHAAIRRWVAPVDGTLSVSGTLQRAGTIGNGIRGRLISSRSGLAGQWVMQTGSIATGADGIKVERGDTIDFALDAIDANAGSDGFEWTMRLDLKTRDGNQLTFDSATGFHGPARSNADVVLAAACLTHEWLRPVGESILKTKLEQTFPSESLRMRPFLRYAHATAVQKRFEDARNVLADSDLALWLPSSTKRHWPQPQGSVRPIWLSDQEHIMHAFGPRNDYLLFKYPLTGDFEFSCETQIGGPGGTTGGCVAYGGLGYEMWASRSLAKIWDMSFHKLAEFHCPFVHNYRIATFNRFSLKSTTGGVTFSANGHPTWIDSSQDGTSPWIGLRTWGERVPIFRNFKITGNPVIPREVKMSAGDSLRGWVADYYRESTPTPPGQAQAGVQAFFKRMMTSYDWSASGGVIHGAKQAAPSEVPSQSRLSYLRPLQNGESISYEFEYQPDQLEVHPTLGRIALLIEPGGVRLHWMTDGDHEWTGLAEDNAVVEPLNRRGPKPLPLVVGEWNRVMVELKRDTLTLSLNDETIYTRKMESENHRTFGFYHDKNRSAVRVRNVIMRGDWPERLTDEQLDNLAAVVEPDRSKADRQLIGALFDDRHVHGSVFAVRRQAAKLPSEERYDFLSEWVLPGLDHHTLRLALDFTPTNPAPPAALAFSQTERDPETGASRVTSGGDLVSPALDLVAVAKELGKLDALRRRVAAVSDVDDLQQRRSKLAMLSLIDMAAGNLATAKRTLDELVSIVDVSNTVAFSDRWPETLVIWEAARYSETREAVRDMTFQIVTDQVRKYQTSGSEAWDQHMRVVVSRIHYFDLLARVPEMRDAAKDHRAGQSPLANWVPTSRETARTRGQGFPRAKWAMSAPATVENFASHHDDFLFYRIPLRGNFEVECDVSGFGYRETNLWAAGRWVGPVYKLGNIDVGTFRDSKRLPLDPPIHKPDDWIRYRATIRDGVCTTYFNGLKVHERPLPADHDPWLAIRSYDSSNGGVRNLRITGNPEIPAEVRLTAEADLPGWLPINEGHRVGPDEKWEYFGGGIRGKRWDSLAGSHRETLLRYHRPMAEGGTIAYEFYYRDGAIHVHPALDRLAFLLQPDAVRVHWMTDDQYDRTELVPDNLFDEPDNRRGPEALPLKQNAWNRLQLSLAGDTVQLKLNDTLVYERKLEATNQRTFGLFHYADRTEALVRNVVWRGGWPRELPPIAEQELAGEGMDFLDESLEELAAVFHHDFGKEGLAPERFGLNGGELTHFDAQPEGLRVTRPGGEGYNDSAIAPHLTIQGDFDIIAAFDHFVPEPSAGGSSGIYMQVIFDSDKSNECLMSRRHLRNKFVPQPVVQGQYVAREVGGNRRSQFTVHRVEAAAGRLRLSRRGETVYYLFAENDSPHFRLYGTQTAVKGDVRLLRLLTQTHLDGSTKVVWKSLTIRADNLTGLALQDREELVAELNQQRDALPHSFKHDFAKDPFTAERFHRWGTWLPNANGLRAISSGADNWTSSGIAPRLGLEGDFDIAIAFDKLKFALPKERENSSLYLQIEFADVAKTQVNALLTKYPGGEQQLHAQVRVLDAGGNKQYRPIGTGEGDSIERVRLTRRGKRVSFLYRESGAEHDRILAQMDGLDLPIPQTYVRLMFHTGGAGRQSEALLKQLSVHAEKIAPNPSDPPAHLEALGKQLADDPPAHALEFDGRTQYVTIPSIRYDGSHPITLEAFVTPDNLGGVVLGDTQQSGIGLQVRQQKYNIHAWNGTGYDTAGLDIPPPRFLRVHLAGTFDGKTLQMFVNGKLTDTRQVTGPFTGSPLPMTIGASPSPNERGIDVAFDGLIDQVRISKTVRYTKDFAVPAQFKSDAATLALFRFDEGKGETLADSSGNRNHGRLRGAKWVVGDAIRVRAAQGLAELGRHGVPVLTEALGDKDPNVQLHAIAALASIGPDASPALSTLEKLASSSDPRVSKAASQAIKLIETGGVLKSILNLFGR